MKLFILIGTLLLANVSYAGFGVVIKKTLQPTGKIQTGLLNVETKSRIAEKNIYKVLNREDAVRQKEIISKLASNKPRIKEVIFNEEIGSGSLKITAAKYNPKSEMGYTSVTIDGTDIDDSFFKSIKDDLENIRLVNSISDYRLVESHSIVDGKKKHILKVNIPSVQHKQVHDKMFYMFGRSLDMSVKQLSEKAVAKQTVTPIFTRKTAIAATSK